ncbi:hypothetical protein FRC0028_02022 [Corynebacterium diphtheriae]|nr:hypothetical protein CIP102550_01847 [Corynebacterium diphtheriae]CAB0700322.1 hypothetical protein FRC0081_01431 [Corynebacterium diphtheriae]CAB0711421.1 hypothetical protein FRC0028_02022 [Corynebacterium diphtheriae]CAB0760597.1 hypothetical protein FRC0134_02020 [Corynebacterium diphtheriae]CAB0777396.1 hypothetical protein FRC0174_02018 [Corynebacterium diphtheriae]
MERVYDLGSVENDFASGGGIALEAVHAGDGDLIMKLRCDYSAMFAKRVSVSFWGNVKKLGGADDVVAQYSRLPARGAFIDGLDGLGFDDDGIFVRLHGRSLVLGWMV